MCINKCCNWDTVTLNKATNTTSNKTCYELKGGNGINFGAYPTDGDVASMTLLEVDMGGNYGQADWYDLSAIPPGSCASHMNPEEKIKSGGTPARDGLLLSNEG